jgi:hypothetical protein
LRCDDGGLFLGRDALLQRDRQSNFEARPVAELRTVLGRVYGDEANWESRVRSVKLVASALNKGEMARAMMTAVLMRLPDPGGAIRIADADGVLAKAGFNPNESRDERGRWTSGGSNGEAKIASDIDGDRERTNANFRSAGIQLADAGLSDAVDDPVTQAAARAVETGTSERDDTPNIVLAAAEGEDERDSRFGIGGNYPPPEELIPQRLQQSPVGPAVQFLDNLLGISEPGDDANLEVAELQQRALLHGIHEIDPNYVYESIAPPGGLAAMSWQERLNVINGLQADLAAAIYRVRGDIRPLQEVTLEFMQRTTNAAYDDGVQLYNTGMLNVRLSPAEAIGNYMDGIVRLDLRQFYNGLSIALGPGSAIRVNSRAYDTSGPDVFYRLPDARVGDFAFDTSLTAKKLSDAQIEGFFNADFKPAGVVIVRPNQLGNKSSYILWREKED